MITELKAKLNDADLVLVGIGEEFEIKRSDMEKDPKYSTALSRYGEDGLLFHYIEKHFIENSDSKAILQRKESYRGLASLLKDKNYFLITLCRDGMIHDTDLNIQRIVEPCGTLRKMQCSDGCSRDLYESDPFFIEKFGELIAGGCEINDIELPVCPKCGKPLVFNHVLSENYIEEGYLKQWQLYKKWLQGTVNRKVCILEFGVGMRFPAVIRWPFEKVTYLNQSAFHFRVHSSLYQITSENSSRSFGIEASPLKFLKELSNGV